MISVEIDNRDFIGFETIYVKRSFTELCGSFNVTAASSTNIPFPVRINDECKILVNDIPVLNGFVEKMDVTYGTEFHSIMFEGRDKACDVCDSTVNNKGIFNPPITLKKVIENILSQLQITDIKVIQSVDIKPFNSSEIESAKIGETYFKFIDKLAKLRQVMLTGDGNGNILITRSSTKQINTVLLNKINGTENNIISANSTFDYTKRFSSYFIISQGNSVAMIDIPQTPKQLTSKKGFSGMDAEIRRSRQFTLISDKSGSDGDLKNRALWEANIRRAQSKIYKCVVQGHIAQKDNIIWKPNVLVKVDDDFSQTSGIFLIKDVAYGVSTKGSFTELYLVTKDAFTLQAEQDARDAKANTQGKTFIDNPNLKRE